MNWFQRYGVPGVYFLGLLVLWTVAFYHRPISSLNIGDRTVQAVLGVVAISFLPVGYLISILQQIIYLRSQRLGITTRAIRRANVFRDDSIRRNHQYWLEAEACLVEVGQWRRGENNGAQPRQNFNVEMSKFFQDWSRSRNNVMAINGSLILATFLAPAIVALVLKIFGLSLQFDFNWCILGFLISLGIILVSVFSWSILSHEVVRVEAGIYRMIAGLPPSRLVPRAT